MGRGVDREKRDGEREQGTERGGMEKEERGRERWEGRERDGKREIERGRGRERDLPEHLTLILSNTIQGFSLAVEPQATL